MSQTDKDRLQYYSRKVKSFIMSPNTHDPQVHPSTYIRIAQFHPSALFPSLRHLYCLDQGSISHISLFLSPLLESLELNYIGGFEDTIVGPFLATLSSQTLSKIVLRDGQMSADILKNTIVHFKHLRSLELSYSVFVNDFKFALWEVLGTLPSLADLTLESNDLTSFFYPAQAPENSNRKSGGRKYFDALESVSIKGFIKSFLIQHLLGFIDSPYLKSIKVSTATIPQDESEAFFTPCMAIVASKWSQSLTTLVISSASVGRCAISNCLMLLTDLHEMQTFHLNGWSMINIDDEVRRLVMSWPKLRTFTLIYVPISLSTLRIIAENCPELRCLRIPLDISSIPPFDTSGKSLRHDLEVLAVGTWKVRPSTKTTSECRIQVARYLNFIFPYLRSIEAHPEYATWSRIRDMVKLCQVITPEELSRRQRK